LAEVLSELDYGERNGPNLAALLEPVHQGAEDGVDLDPPYQEIWLSGVLETYALAGLAPPSRPASPPADRSTDD
jgi:hypothetical protein